MNIKPIVPNQPLKRKQADYVVQAHEKIAIDADQLTKIKPPQMSQDEPFIGLGHFSWAPDRTTSSKYKEHYFCEYLFKLPDALRPKTTFAHYATRSYIVVRMLNTNIVTITESSQFRIRNGRVPAVALRYWKSADKEYTFETERYICKWISPVTDGWTCYQLTNVNLKTEEPTPVSRYYFDTLPTTIEECRDVIPTPEVIIVLPNVKRQKSATTPIITPTVSASSTRISQDDELELENKKLTAELESWIPLPDDEIQKQLDYLSSSLNVNDFDLNDLL